MGLMIISTTLTPELLGQLIFRSIFTNVATLFSHSTFSSFGTHFIKSADIVDEISYYLLEIILTNNVLPIPIFCQCKEVFDSITFLGVICIGFSAIYVDAYRLKISRGTTRYLEQNLKSLYFASI